MIVSKVEGTGFRGWDRLPGLTLVQAAPNIVIAAAGPESAVGGATQAAEGGVDLDPKTPKPRCGDAIIKSVKERWQTLTR